MDELPDLVYLEIKVLRPNGIESSICVVPIDITEDIPPVIIPNNNSVVRIRDNDEQDVTIDTSDIIQSLIDNSSCLTSLVMTGSGLGPLTGSGIPILYDGEFMTFTCSDTGMYDVQIIATDCDNNMDTIVTTLTVDSDGMCTPSPSTIISGSNSCKRR